MQPHSLPLRNTRWIPSSFRPFYLRNAPVLRRDFMLSGRRAQSNSCGSFPGKWITSALENLLVTMDSFVFGEKEGERRGASG